jgi:DNA polymerase-1
MSNNSSRPVKAGDHLYLIDGSGYIFRAYHALPPLTRKSDGLPVGAVQGFCNMLYKLLKQMSAEDQPTHIAVIFDKSSKSFRNEIYPQYKAHRPDAPADLVPQFGLIRQATVAFNVACIEQDNYEADDLIATYARQAEAAGATVRIVSSDKDLMQLVTDNVALYDTMKDKEIGRDEVIEKFGVPPEKVIEVQALAGDSVDNIPGVPGIGVKTGAQLIEEYGDLETLLARAEEIKQPKRREKLIEFADQARVSKQLVTLKTDVPLDHELDEFGVIEPDPKPLIGFLKALEFTTLTRRIAGDLDADAGEIEPVAVTFKGWPPEGEAVDELGAAKPQAAATPASPQAAAAASEPVAGQAASVIAERMRAIPLDHSAYETVTTMDRLKAWVELIRETGYVAVDTETTSLDNMQADLAGISLSVEPGKACYIPTGHRASDGLDFGGGSLDQLKQADVLATLQDVLEHPGILKIGQNLKYDLTIFARLGINLAPIDDTMLMSYALD